MGSHRPTEPARQESKVLRVGDVLDSRYRITGVLGSGGMGCVYRAEHVAIGRPVALKLLHPEVENIEGIPQRFEREAFAIGRVDHPNCVNVSDFGQLEDGTLYMALEVLDGAPLFDLIAQEHRLPWRRALHIGRHVLHALAHAHKAGIVHRDIKPENVILVEEAGDPDFAKILDFGIAKLFDNAQVDAENPGLTQLGVVIGTPTYMAPEQAFGQPVDGRADLYSLSIMLFEMIAGVPPFEADQAVALLAMHTSSEVPAIADVAPEVRVPRSVEALIRKGLEKKREDRPGSAQEYISAIDRLLATEHETGATARDDSASLTAQMRAGAESLRESLAPAVAKTVQTAVEFPRNRTRKELFSGFAVGLFLFTIIVALFGAEGPDYLPTRSRLPLVTPKHGPEAEAAAEMLEKGQPKEAAAFLQSKKTASDDPYAQLVLGHAHASAQRNVAAMEAYRRAISLERDLAKDKLLRTNLDLMRKKEDPRVYDAAVDLMATLIREADDDTAADELIEMTSSGTSVRARHRAIQVADELGLGDRINRLESYILDLEQGSTCGDRRDAVANLRALGDKRAIPALRKAKTRTRTEGLLKRKTNANACLSRDASEAIEYLESV